MSTVITDNLTGKTSAGDVTITSEGGAVTMQLQQGVAKAWVNFNGTGTIAARDSFNVTSLTDNGTGDYTVTYSNSMSNGNYAVNTSANNTISFYSLMSSIDTSSGVVLVGSARFFTASSSTLGVDARTVNFSLHGDLA
jgi:hypothetical protein